MFYLRLAYRSLFNHRSDYAQFLMGTLVYYVLFATIGLVFNTPGVDHRISNYYTWVLAIYPILLVFMEVYSYRFLLKKQQKRWGLYTMLGINKVQITALLVIELLTLYLVTVILGTLLSCCFANVLYLIFAHITEINLFAFTLTMKPLILSAFVFMGVFGLCLVLGCTSCWAISPLHLFEAERVAEREWKTPKTWGIVLAIVCLTLSMLGLFIYGMLNQWLILFYLILFVVAIIIGLCSNQWMNTLFAMISLAGLGTGYYLAWFVERLGVIEVMTRFGMAVVFVIVGTYAFYMVFVPWLLKRLQAARSTYAHPTRFVLVSQLLYRFSQHAIGLANVTILATMACVTVSATASIYLSSSILVDKKYPYAYAVDRPHVDSHAQAEELFGQTSSLHYLYSFQSMEVKTKGHSVRLKESRMPTNFAYILTQADAKALGNQLPKLGQNEVVLVDPKLDQSIQQLHFHGQQWKVVDQKTNFEMPEYYTTVDPLVLVVADEAQLVSLAGESGLSAVWYLDHAPKPKEGFYISSRADMKQSFQKELGSFMFVGMVLSLAFLIGAAMILFYKQVMEDRLDREQYWLLQDLGMEKKMVKRMIHVKTIFIFVAPLLFATLHLVFAQKILTSMLTSVIGKMVVSILGISLGVMLIALLLYGLMYWFASRSSVRMVSRQ